MRVNVSKMISSEGGSMVANRIFLRDVYDATIVKYEWPKSIGLFLGNLEGMRTYRGCDTRGIFRPDCNSISTVSDYELE